MAITTKKSRQLTPQAGNTEIPCYLAIRLLSYEFSRANAGEKDELWIAENSDNKFVVSNQLELLSLICMRDIRGQKWKAW